MRRPNRKSAPLTPTRGLSVAVLLLAFVGPAQAEDDREQTRAAMRAIYAQIVTLLPLSVNDQAFRSEESRPRIKAALTALARGADNLAEHVPGQPRQVQFLGNALAREAQGARARFESDRMESAQFFVRRLTDYCVACHSRLPSPADSPLAKSFLDDGELARQPLPRRAELQIATRQFDEALDTFEALFASPTRHTAEFLEPITQYLRVAVGVKGDLVRPVPILRKLATRPDLSETMRADMESWTATLERHAKRDVGAPSLAAARDVLAETDASNRSRHDRRALVHDLLAASRLHRYLEAHPEESSRNVAEAYYLLGSIESRTHTNYRFFEVEFYLETAIRMAPTDPVAASAFALLEQETVLGWVGSSGSNMPEPVRENLEHLRGLVYPDSKADSR